MESMHIPRYLDMMNQWLILKQEKKSIYSYIKKQGWKSVAIYGMAIYGRHVIRELKETDCIVMYGIDRKEMNEYEGIEIVKPTEKLSKVDAVINTVIYEHAAIEKILKNALLCPVVSLEDIIYASY